MESVGTLAGGIAHDFNNLLNIIQGYAFILRGQCELNEEMEESLVAINDTVQRGSALVHQLLTLGGKSRSIELKPVDINILVEQINRTHQTNVPQDHRVGSHTRDGYTADSGGQKSNRTGTAEPLCQRS